MKYYFKKIEEIKEDTLTEGQQQMIIIEVADKNGAIAEKVKYDNLFKGTCTMITNRHEENESCTEEVI